MFNKMKAYWKEFQKTNCYCCNKHMLKSKGEKLPIWSWSGDGEGGDFQTIEKPYFCRDCAKRADNAAYGKGFFALGQNCGQGPQMRLKETELSFFRCLTEVVKIAVKLPFMIILGGLVVASVISLYIIPIFFLWSLFAGQFISACVFLIVWIIGMSVATYLDKVYLKKQLMEKSNNV